MKPRFRMRLWVLMLLVAAAAGVSLVVRERETIRWWLRNRAILEALGQPVAMRYPTGIPLEDLLKQVKSSTPSKSLRTGIPIYVDPVGLQKANATMTTPVTIDVQRVPLGTALRTVLNQLGLTYIVKDGLFMITAKGSEDEAVEAVFGAPR